MLLKEVTNEAKYFMQWSESCL